MPKLEMETAKCIGCEKDATFWCGHVLDRKQKIQAGWCSKYCYDTAEKVGMQSDRHGCFGKYERWMKKRVWDTSQVDFYRS